MSYYYNLKTDFEKMSKDDPEYKAIEKHILFMEKEMENCDSMEPRDYIPPSEYDVLLSDVKHDDLVGPIAERLGIKYLEPQCEIIPMEKDIKGILYGTNRRPMVNLVVSAKRFKTPVNVIFLVDTGSPCLYLCQKAMEALGFSDAIPYTFDLRFRDRVYEAVMSPLKQLNGKDGHYHDINLIGATFLTNSRALLTIDYMENDVTLSFK